MQEVLLFGTNELSERIDYYIEHGESTKPFSVKGFVIDDDYYTGEDFAGKKVYRYSEAKENFLKTVPIIVCIGYKNMNENRKKIFYKLKEDGWIIESYVSSETKNFAASMGVGNIFLCNSRAEVNCRIGDGNIFDGAVLSHHSVMGNFNFLCGDSMTGGKIQIGDCCFIGMNSCIQDGIKLHDKTLVGAGCYLRHSTKKPGQCYAAPKSIRLGNSEDLMAFADSAH